MSKDPYILSNSVSRLDRNITNYLHSGRNLSEITMDYIVKKVKKLNFGKNKQIVVCGMAFKGDPITDDLRDSTSIKLFSKLKQKLEKLGFGTLSFPQKNLKITILKLNGLHLHGKKNQKKI